MEQFKISRALSLSFTSWFRNFIPFTLLAAVLYAPVVIWLETMKPEAQASGEDLLNTFFTYPIYFTIGTSMLVPPLLARFGMARIENDGDHKRRSAGAQRRRHPQRDRDLHLLRRDAGRGR